MQITRPKTLEVAPVEAEVHLSFTEHLVEKAMLVNPALAPGQTPAQVTRTLRQQTTQRIDKASVSATPTPSQSTNSNHARPRRETDHRAVFGQFCRRKAGELEAALRELEERRASLERQHAELRERIIDDVLDFVVLIPAGLSGDETRAVLAESRGLLSELGLSEIDLARRSAERHRQSQLRAVSA